jgi:coproporphyrinogen III oxidase-like Fe-S oxidoreductase
MQYDSAMRDDAWWLRRKALHSRYMDVAKVGDASRLGYLHGEKKTWTEEEVADLWRRSIERTRHIPAPALNCIYVHVPFCKSICTFCNYDRLQPSSPSLLTTWLARVRRSIEVLAPAVRPLTFQALYIGGGTPSVLPARLLRELLETLDSAFAWHPLAVRRFEFDPLVISRERLEVLAKHRFSELSFGIQTLDAATNMRHNRGPQDLDVIDRCFANLRKVRLSRVACDFLLGLEGTTPESILAEIETVVTRYRPWRVDIYTITPTHSYLKQHFGGSWDAYWAHVRRFEAAVPAAISRLAARTGYAMSGSSRHCIVLKDRRAFDLRTSVMNFRRGLLGRAGRMNYSTLVSDARRPLNVLGLGRSARSLVFGTAAFRAHDPQDDPALEGPAQYVGQEMDLRSEVRTFLALVLRESNIVSRREFRWIFGADLEEVIPDALEAWSREGTARLDRRALRLAPQDRHARLRSLLWLVPEEDIEFDLGHFHALDLTAAGVARLTNDLAPGTVLAGGHVFEGTEGVRMILRAPEGGSLRLRIAPELTEGDLLRLEIEEAPPSADATALGATIRQLRTELSAARREFRQSLPIVAEGSRLGAG